MCLLQTYDTLLCRAAGPDLLGNTLADGLAQIQLPATLKRSTHIVLLRA